MGNNDILAEDYYIWLLHFVEDSEYKTCDYTKLLNKLWNTEFYSILNYDDNRIADGLDLRNEFADLEVIHIYYLADNLPEYCTVLEMMIALAKRLENDILYDEKYGDRTSKWFWMMVENLGLADSYDGYFREYYVQSVLERFLERQYKPNGKGGLFVVNSGQKSGQIDMRGTEIWYQAQYFLDEIL